MSLPKSFANWNRWKRFAPLYVLMLVYVVAGALLRLVLWAQFGQPAQVSAASLAWILPSGIVNDLVQGLYLLAPFALYLFLMRDRWHRSRTGRIAWGTLIVLSLAVMLFLCVMEYYFFEEFDARFNLVAVDYLVYPTEVVGDIRDAYPVKTALAITVAVSVAIYWALRRAFTTGTGAVVHVRRRIRPALAYLCVLTVAAMFAGTGVLSHAENRVARELAANGAATFFRAVRTSELEYPAYYVTRDSETNFNTLTSFLAREGGELTALNEGRLNRRFPADPAGLGRLNLVVVVEESFGAEFSKLYGCDCDLTPNFDAFAQRGLLFRNMYASGTRTVRGLEAIVASFPPIPSVSILRRPNNEGIATWGGVMQKQGYRSSFLYGGYGYFDNMNHFFASNGYEVLDRNDIGTVRFENIWGVSDEDLFDRALDYYDEQHASGTPFFSVVMTTSNHKPFSFREGIPGVPAQGGGRAAGVRYADFALGYFLREAEQHAWFENTVFVVLADHGARVYGKADIPLRTYEIPMMVYSPAHVKPGRVDTLTSQIDVAPTVLGMLGFEYEAPFFGTNVLAANPEKRVALFNHNYDVAIYRDGKLAVLGLGQQLHTLRYNPDRDVYNLIKPDADLSELGVAIYQTAYEQFKSHRYE